MLSRLTPKPFLLLIGIIVFHISLAKAQDPFQYTHSELEWQTFETEHFFVHFHKGTERTAKIVAGIGEDIFKPITTLYNYRPDGKIHFIIKDTDDYSNGGAYFFDNKIEIWAQNLDYIMRGTKNWLRDVVTHEFTHMISIQNSVKTSRTVPYGFLQIFGYEPERRKDVVRGFPNTLVSYPISSITIPVWFAEGVAQYQADSARYDYRDPHREMIIRDRVIHDQLLTYGEMGVFGKNSHGNESAYNLGFAFVKYLSERFGESVLEKITEESSRLSVLTFEQALKNATGIAGDSLYNQWKMDLEASYGRDLKVILSNEVKGNPVETEGFANLYPIWSPDGRKIVYVSNKGSDSYGQNYLVEYDVADKSKKRLVPKISSSISWSPDGQYIAFTRHEAETWTGSSFQDLYIYDLKSGDEKRLTRKLRGKNPDWSHDGKKIAFVSEASGINQLFIYHIDDLLDNDWKSLSIDKSNGFMQEKPGENSGIRKVEVRGGHIEQLTRFEDGRQLYHPRWAPGDEKIVIGTATGYGRNIAQYTFSDGSFRIIMAGKEELRYPVFHPEKNWLYYASSETGIYNIYRLDLDTNERSLLTNVPGGAMMPHVNKRGDITYACYDSIGYHIYMIAQPLPVAREYAIYQENYLASVPDKNFDDSILGDWTIKPYRQKFTGLHIMPRLWFDYGTFKPGIYLFSGDVLDKMSLIAGAAVNSRMDYDLYGAFEYREYFPTIFIEAYNLSQNITDTTSVRTGKNSEIIEQKINFDLTEIQAGFRFSLPAEIQWRFLYRLSLYHAKLEWFDPFVNDIINFRYRYLNGHAFEVRMQADHIPYSKYKSINPGSGRFFQLKYTYENNDFLEDFDTGKNIALEVYKKYSFNRIEMDWEEYFTNPFLDKHAFTIRLQAGYIDRSVDDYFYLWAGGFVGMKGYSYFSIGGTKKTIATLTYRFPIFDHIDWQVFNFYFDKLYFGVFYDYGNAWVEDKIDFSKFKDDVGFQLRLDSFSNYFFPTKVFFEAVYPLDDLERFNTFYDNKWRYYFGILFDFDLRERLGTRHSFGGN